MQTIGPCRLVQERLFAPRRLELSNVLTLNGDGLNEKLIKLPEAAAWQLNLADRWGREKAIGTVGNLNWPPANQKSGTYYYNLTNASGLRCKGWVEVVR